MVSTIQGARSTRNTHHVEVSEHVALSVLLVSLIDVGAHGHQQLQVQDTPGSPSPDARVRRTAC